VVREAHARLVDRARWLLGLVRDASLAVLRAERGATAAEYAVLIALIAAVIFAGAQILGVNVDARITDMGNDMGSF